MTIQSLGDDLYRCEHCGLKVRTKVLPIHHNCHAAVPANTRPVQDGARDTVSDNAARCRACPHVRRETPFAISCLVLDGEIACARERIGRHQKRLLDSAWRCERHRPAAPRDVAASPSPDS